MAGEHEVKNPELHDRLQDLVVKAFALLRQKRKGGSKFEFITIVEGGLVIGEKRQLHVFPGGRRCRRKPDLSLFVFQHTDELVQLPEWMAAIECLSGDSVIRRQLTGQLVSPFGGFLDVPNLLRLIVNMSTDEEKPFRFVSELFDAVYDEVERHFYCDSVVRKSFCPLLGFSSEADEINLDKEVKIRRISRDEILDLWNNSAWFRALVEGNTMAFSIHAPLQYVIELSVEARKTAPSEKVEVLSTVTVFDKVVSALRLFKEGWVSYPFYFQRQVSRLASGTYYGRSGSLPSIPMRSYELNKDEVENFKAFYTEIEGQLDNSRIARGLPCNCFGISRFAREK